MMANCCMTVPQAEISALKEALCTQQKLLQKLYNELEAEREASATAASEALSVILRLQGEKAAVKMEAEQYKRLAEERMCHAEESFALIEDMITEKEMEVAELDYQVQTYRYQLMSMGFNVPAAEDMSFPDNLFHRNEALAGESSLHMKCKKAMLELQSSTSADLEFMSKPLEDETLGQEIHDFTPDLEKKVEGSTHEGMFSYAEQIKDLELRIKEMTGVNITGFMSESPTPALSKFPSAANLASLSNSQQETKLPSQLSIGSSFDPNKLGVVDEISEFKHPENLLENSKAVHSPRPPRVHDVFEVPQIDQESTIIESPIKDRQKEASQANEILEIQEQSTQREIPHIDKESNNDRKKEVCESSEILERQDLAHPESVKQITKDEPDWLKKLLQSTHHEKNLCKPSDIAAMDHGIAQPVTSVAVAFVQPRTSVDVSESNLNKLNGSPEISEVEGRAPSSEREAEMKLLIEIREKLNKLQDEIVLQKINKCSTIEEPSLQPLAEVLIITILSIS